MVLRTLRFKQQTGQKYKRGRFCFIFESGASNSNDGFVILTCRSCPAFLCCSITLSGLGEHVSYVYQLSLRYNVQIDQGLPPYIAQMLQNSTLVSHNVTAAPGNKLHRDTCVCSTRGKNSWQQKVYNNQVLHRVDTVFPCFFRSYLLITKASKETTS